MFLALMTATLVNPRNVIEKKNEKVEPERWRIPPWKLSVHETSLKERLAWRIS